MNELFKAIYAKFTSATDVHKAVGGRLYLNHAPQNVALPYIVFFEFSAVNDLGFSEAAEEFMIQFSVYSQNNSATEAGEILTSLKKLYDSCEININGWNTIYCLRNFTFTNNDYSFVPPIHGYCVEYKILIEQQRSA